MSIQSGDNPHTVRQKLRTFYVGSPSTLSPFKDMSIDEIKNRIERAPKTIWGFDTVTDLMTDMSVVSRRDGIAELECYAFVDRLPVLALEPFEQAAITRWHSEELPDGVHPLAFLGKSKLVQVPPTCHLRTIGIC